MSHHPPNGGWNWSPGRPVLRSIVTLTALVLVAGACGTGLSHDELLAANGGPIVVEDGGAAAGTRGGAPSGGQVGTEGSTSGGVTGSAGGGTGANAGGTGAGTGSGAESGTTGTAAGAAPGANRSPIVLGSVGVAGGPIGATVAAAPDGARAWVASVNARGGLNGHPVQLIVADDGADSARTAAIVRRLVDEDGVVALFATYAPTTLQAATPYLEDRGIPVIGGVSGNSVEESSPIVFNPQAGPSIVPPASAITVARQLPPEQRKLAVIYCQESAQCSIIRDGLHDYGPENGVEIVYEAQVSLAQPDFTAQVSQARSRGATVVFLAADVNSLIRLARSSHRQGWYPVLAGAFQNDTDDIKPYSEELEGLLGFSLTVNYDSSDKLADYRDALRRYVPGGRVGGLGAQAWTQGKLLEAIAPQFGDAVGPADIITALYTLRGETLGGLVPPITFNEGPHLNVNTCLVPTLFTGGRWTQPLGEEFVCVTYK